MIATIEEYKAVDNALDAVQRMRDKTYTEKAIAKIGFGEILNRGLILVSDFTPETSSQVFLKACETVCPGFIVDENNKDCVQLLVEYATGSPEFEKKGYSLKKGIMLRGPVGTGKTVLMEALRRFSIKFPVNPDEGRGFTIIPSYQIASQFSMRGAEIFNYDGFYLPGHSGISLMGRIIMIDDLGAEPIVKHFGNESNVIGELILRRYDQARLITHCTSNLSREDIKTMYGDRVFSRMNAMFNNIILKGDDRRY